MSRVKIKAEPTAAATTTTAAVDVKVKLEPRLSTADIKLEQHSSEIDAKVESDSDIDSEEDEEGEVKSENDDGTDDDEEDTDQDQFTITPKKQQRWVCKYPDCSRRFNCANELRVHQHEHRLQMEINMYKSTYILTRQSLEDRWQCPILICTSTAKTVKSLYSHIRSYHAETMEQQQQNEAQPLSQITRCKRYYFDVDNFYVNGARCGYHTTTGVFICHECKLVPECLLTHLQQKHGYNEKSIDNSALPDSAVNASANPNIDQHTRNPLLAATIRQPYRQQHRDIVQGWVCVTSGCGYCGYAASQKNDHKRKVHQGDQIETIPALVLRFVYAKARSSYFLITRIDQTSDAVTTKSERVNRHKLGYSHNGLNTQDENDDDANQSVTTDTFSQKRNYICDYPNCGQFFNSSSQLSEHRREHKLEVMITVRGAPFILSRHSLDDRWTCPISDCETTRKSVATVKVHIRDAHSTLIRQKRASMKDDEDQQHPVIKKAKITFRYFDVDNFYVNDVRCGYHTSTGVFICHECKLVPECLLSHLQQKHGFDEKSIGNVALPDNAVTVNADPSINQHTSNSLLAAAISQPSQQQHPDIVQGWLCVASDCGYCCSTKASKNTHHYIEHRSEQQSAVPALVLRLLYEKTRTSGFLITRLDTTTDSVEPSNPAGQNSSECDVDDVDDGDELVLSDYSDEDDIN